MALSIVRLFAEGYGVDPALTNLVEQREIWVLPNVNPDGGEFDLTDDNYQFWRKNMRPNAGNSVGVDLNRNYDYHWGCCGGSSGWGYSDLFRGPAAFSEPETQVVRDFVLAHPDITTAISFHTYGEFILYPFGYTYDRRAGRHDAPRPLDLRRARRRHGRDQRLHAPAVQRPLHRLRRRGRLALRRARGLRLHVRDVPATVPTPASTPRLT